MPQKKLNESFAVRMFILMFCLMIGAGAVTFFLIAWATPSAYLTVISQDLRNQTDSLAKTLSRTAYHDWETVLNQFFRSSQAEFMLLTAGGEQVLLDSRSVLDGSEISVSLAETGGHPAKESIGRVNTSWDLEDSSPMKQTEEADNPADTATIAALPQYAFFADAVPSDGSVHYTLCVIPHAQKENLAVRALVQMAPWLFLALLSLSLFCAFFCSRYIAGPVVRISRIAGRLAELDFSESCGEHRRDEIGLLARSLDQMAGRLRTALSGLSAANEALKKEMERERGLERSRMEFFFAASHELKTPLTILKGQLSGMLAGIDVYRDRDKYLLRSLQVTGRMERLVGEMLSICRIETGASPVEKQPLDLPELIKMQLKATAELTAQKRQTLTVTLEPAGFLTGDPVLMEKAIGNLLSNAVRYSPEEAEIRVWCGLKQNAPAISIENTGAHIHEDALPHLFEPFYRADSSRNRTTGGSGLGLYLTQAILKRHQASCTIKNTSTGVLAFVSFALPPESPPSSSTQNT